MAQDGNHEARLDVPREPSTSSDALLRQRIQASFERQGLMRHLGASLGDVRPGEVHIHLPYGPHIAQQLGYVDAGATTSIADSAGGYAALTLAPEGHAVLSVEFKINLLAPAVGESFEAVGRVIRHGRMLTITQVDVYSNRAGHRKAVALMQQTLTIIPEQASR